MTSNSENTEDMGADIEDAYRYLLWRRAPIMSPHYFGRILWVMLNPSTADWRSDDPTIRKVMGFSTRWEFHEVRVVNLCALRSTDPSGLDNKTIDVVGARNIQTIQDELAKADRVVLAWGANAETRVEAKKMAAVVQGLVIEACLKPHTDVVVLGRTKGGSPKHPLMLSYQTKLEWVRTSERRGQRP